MFNILILFRFVAGAGAASHFAKKKNIMLQTKVTTHKSRISYYILFMLAKFLLILVIRVHHYVFIIYMQNSLIYVLIFFIRHFYTAYFSYLYYFFYQVLPNPAFYTVIVIFARLIMCELEDFFLPNPS